MATIPDRELEFSSLGGRITRDGCTVEVHIYRVAGTDAGWTLEVVDHDGGCTTWEDTFDDDHEAYEAFEQVAAEDGIQSFAEQPAEH